MTMTDEALEEYLLKLWDRHWRASPSNKYNDGEAWNATWVAFWQSLREIVDYHLDKDPLV